MPSTPSNSLRLEEQFTGENVNVWGVLLNQVIAMIDAGVAGLATIPLNGDYTLTSHNYVADEARNMILKFTGSVAAAVTIPSVPKIYLVWNANTQPVSMTTGSGTTVSIDPGDVVVVLCDTTNVKTLGYGGLSLKNYITSYAAGSGAVPSPLGNTGKVLFALNDTTVIWQQLTSANLSDTAARTATATGLAIAFAVSL